MTVTAPATPSLLARFLDVRVRTERLAAPLSPEDPAYTEGATFDTHHPERTGPIELSIARLAWMGPARTG